jgi:hypothetical protein
MEIVRNRDCEPSCQPWSVANVDGKPCSGTMEHGLTMDPHDGDFGAIDARLLEQAFDRLGVRLGHQFFSFEDPGRTVRSTKAQASASARRSSSRSGRE